MKENIINYKDSIAAKIQKAEKNYVIQPNDYLEIRLFTANGQALIQPITPPDPNNPLGQMGIGQIGAQGMGQMGMQGVGAGGAGGSVGGGNPFPLEAPIFHVRSNGNMNLPVLGDVNLLGMDLYQADSVLRVRYSAELLYKDCYVRTRFMTKRVMVYTGGTAIVFPLRNEKIQLTELIASVGGISNQMRGSNIRLVRGDPNNPNVYIIDLRTMESRKKSIDNMVPYHSLVVEPNDMIYIEPIRKTFWEVLGDVSQPIAALTGTITTVLALFILLRK